MTVFCLRFWPAVFRSALFWAWAWVDQCYLRSISCFLGNLAWAVAQSLSRQRSHSRIRPQSSHRSRRWLPFWRSWHYYSCCGGASLRRTCVFALIVCCAFPRCYPAWTRHTWRSDRIAPRGRGTVSHSRYRPPGTPLTLAVTLHIPPSCEATWSG